MSHRPASDRKSISTLRRRLGRFVGYWNDRIQRKTDLQAVVVAVRNHAVLATHDTVFRQSIDNANRLSQCSFQISHRTQLPETEHKKLLTRRAFELRPETPTGQLQGTLEMKKLTTKQRTDYVVQIAAGLVAANGNPTAAQLRIKEIVKLVERIEKEISDSEEPDKRKKTATK
jgi:hypothetical protein